MTLWPFDEINEDRRTRTPTLEHLVPKSLSNMALLKYYGCLLFFKCLQMYPAKAPFQLLKWSQKSLFIFMFMHRQKNSRAVNLVPTVKDVPLVVGCVCKWGVDLCPHPL